MKTRDFAGRRAIALAVAMLFLVPLLALPVGAAYASPQTARTQQQKGMSTRKKVVLVAGAALLYYLYRKHQAKKAENERRQTAGAIGQTPTGTRTTASNRMPQLYRSKNGGVYYRDEQGKAVWLTAPSRSLQVPADELRRYAPDWNRYRGPAPSVPSGARTESFEDFNSDLFSGTSYTGRTSGGGGGGTVPPGPRGF